MFHRISCRNVKYHVSNSLYMSNAIDIIIINVN